MKSTLKREVKKHVTLLKRETIEVSRVKGIQPSLAVYLPFTGQHQFDPVEKGGRKVAPSGVL